MSLIEGPVLGYEHRIAFFWPVHMIGQYEVVIAERDRVEFRRPSFLNMDDMLGQPLYKEYRSPTPCNRGFVCCRIRLQRLHCGRSIPHFRFAATHAAHDLRLVLVSVPFIVVPR